ncbi:uncharacterized protein LOC141601756 [Silene latifolia]|uniref:uncharacterized protein LOC141601756 n=1 Tax=Silene latifolia TaxID=37657 RepID=UPI003D776EC5
MEAQLKSLEQRMEEQNQKLQAQLLEQNKTMEDQLAQLMQLLKDRPIESFGEESGGTLNRHRNSHNHQRQFGYVPKIEFPSFHGENSRLWIQKCEKYFNLCKVPDDQKVDLAAIHMIGKAESWFNAYIAARNFVSWSTFIIDVCARFKDKLGANVVEQFNRLHQTGSLEDYLDSFEHLKSLMVQRNPLLPDSYFLDSFIGGLRPTVKPFVQAFKPETLAKAVEFARLQEESVEATKNYTKNYIVYPTKNNPSFSSTKQQPILATPQYKSNYISQNNSKANLPRKNLTMAERAEKIAKGLCYLCDQPYDRNHQCKFKQSQLFTIFVPAENEWGSEGDFGDARLDDSHRFDNEFEVNNVDPCISVNALAGNQAFQAMRVTGYIGKKPLHILVNSGITHNFLDLSLAKKMGLDLEKITPQAVTVADGNHLACQYVCKGFSWRLQNTEFKSDALLIPLGGCDMVLGVQWLSNLGTVKWNFKKLWMTFEYEGQHHMLRGIPPKLDKSGAANNKDQGYPKAIGQLLEIYKDVFAEPTKLPPSRGVFDHRISLENDVAPVNIRPYRYPLKQRDVIEQLIKEMLDRGVIQQSCSPFASPVVLVGKKDGSWRLCVDYRELDKKIIKDKFSIPVVDELIDELAGATVFSKLDLRAGYHQLRIHDSDVYKTAFKTHSGHYEFLVMPFGLTNALASFQSWMNYIFKPLLRKHVLVFFDDILVYNNNLEDHVNHLKQVFDLMQQHSLYAKPSKCYFAIDKVEYLGHFISAKGVETDPQKIAAVENGISKPLTDQLKKEGFSWGSEAQLAFEKLKRALVIAHVLAVPDYSKTFVVETDVSQSGIGAVLMQYDHPLAYISKTLGPKWQRLSVYEKELLALYNTNFHIATHLTPYEIVYNQPPPVYLPYFPGETKVEAVDRSLQWREAVIQSLKYHLKKAQDRMKSLADRGRTDRRFDSGDWPYRQSTVALRVNQKLAAKYFGPFQIEAATRKVAYRLKLPPEAQIHNVFHVSQLKQFRGVLPDTPLIPPWFRNKDCLTIIEPEAILDRRVVKFQNMARAQYLVQWVGFSETEASWEYADEFEAKFPTFNSQT